MSKLAQADVVVERAALRRRGAKAAIRLRLYDELTKLGHVDSVDRFVMDVRDGPFSEQGFDREMFTIVRVVGHVTPFSTGGRT